MKCDLGPSHWYARHGRNVMGCRSELEPVPCTSLGVSRRSVYQMIALIDKVLGEGNCVRATERGEEACEWRSVSWQRTVARRTLTKAARLRTETSYKAGSVRRVSQSSQSRTHTTAQVNGELAQRNITFLSGETCKMACEPSLAPESKACLKVWNGQTKVRSGNAGVSRGRSSNPRIPIEMRRTER